MTPPEGLILRPQDLGIGRLFESVRDAVIVAEANSGRIVLWNPAATKIFGYSPSEALKLRVEALVPERLKDRHRTGIARYAETGHGPYIDSDELLDLPAVRKTGEEIRVEMSLSPIEPVPASGTEGRFVLAIVRDVTGRKMAQEEARRLNEDLGELVAERTGQLEAALARLEERERGLRRSEERYRTFIEQSTEGIWRFELEEPVPTNRPEDEQIEHFYRHSYLAECNDAMARMYGFSRAEEILGTRLDDLLPRSVPDNVEYLRGFIRSGYRLADAESEEIDREGNTRYFLNNLTGIVEGGSLVRAWGTQRDITERKQAEEARSRLLAQERAARAEAEEAQRRLAFLAEASAMLSSSLDYHETLASVARLAVPHLADWCVVDVLEEDGSLNRLAVTHQDPEKVRWAQELQERYPPDPDSPYGVPKALRTGEPELLPEVPEALLDEAARDEEHREIVRELGLESYMVVPLIARGRTLGAISLVSAESGRRYGEADLRLTEELARRAALAVDNARLYHEAQREIAERERVEEALREVREAERSRLARDLHDGALQDLTYALAEAELVQRLSEDTELNARLEQVAGALKRAGQGLRGAVYDLRLTEERDRPFPESLESLVELSRRMNPGCNIRLDLEDGFPSAPFGRTGVELLRIVQEALNNARRHSEARNVRVALRLEDDEIQAEVSDDGRGFEPRASKGGLGISSMCQRAEALGGELGVKSEPGEGTRVRVRVPLAPRIQKE